MRKAVSPCLAVSGRRGLATASTAARPRVKIVEVGPRDGLQNEASILGAATKANLIARLAGHGLRNIEAGSLVSPRVKQMSNTRDVLVHPELCGLPKDVSLSVLVPNMRGLQSLFDIIDEMGDTKEQGRVQEVAVFVSATESFSKANLNATIAESLDRAATVTSEASGRNLKVRGYVSCVVGCPFEGNVDPKAVENVAAALASMGCYEISLGDTIGVGTPASVENMFNGVSRSVPLSKVAAHCHDTYGTAVSNVLRAALLGVRTFDSSIAGLGGCPFAPGAAGNVATEDIAYALEMEGYETGLFPAQYERTELVRKLVPLAHTGQWISQQLGRESSSKVGKAVLAAARPQARL